MSKFISYIRVSGAKQEKSGLGLEAQREAIGRYATNADRVLAHYVETESGRNCQRPELTRAIEHCRQTGAILLIAKLDRLARNVAFIATLMESDVRFVACDRPDADPFRLHIEAAIGEEESRKISERTKAALGVARARGVKLGGHRAGCRRFTAADVQASVARRQAVAAARCARVLPVVAELQARGASTLRQLAAGLNARGIGAPKGASWSAVQVSRVIAKNRLLR